MIRKNRTVDAAGQGSWKRAFKARLALIGALEHTEPLLESLERGQAESTAVGYILYLIGAKGKRAEQLTQARSMGKAVSESDRGQGNIWEAAIVIGATQTGRRSDKENKEQTATMGLCGASSTVWKSRTSTGRRS